jgi:hypothetical protein
MRSSIGGLVTVARHGRDAVAARARAGQQTALNARLLAEIDAYAATAGITLSDEERARRLDDRRRAYYRALRLRRASKAGQS